MNEEVQNVTEVTENVETQTTEQTVEKTFTQEEVDNIIKARLRNMPSKEELNEFKSWKESQKTEAEKQAEYLKEIETIKRENQELKNTQVVANAGVDPKFMKFVSSEVSQLEGEFEDNLKSYLKDNPQYLFQEKMVSTGITQNKSNQVANPDKAYLDKKYANNPFYKK